MYTLCMWIYMLSYSILLSGVRRWCRTCLYAYYLCMRAYECVNFLTSLLLCTGHASFVQDLYACYVCVRPVIYKVCIYIYIYIPKMVCLCIGHRWRHRWTTNWRPSATSFCAVAMETLSGRYVWCHRDAQRGGMSVFIGTLSGRYVCCHGDAQRAACKK